LVVKSEIQMETKMETLKELVQMEKIETKSNKKILNQESKNGLMVATNGTKLLEKLKNGPRNTFLLRRYQIR